MQWMLWVRLTPLILLTLSCCICFISCGYFIFEDRRENIRIRDDDYYPNEQGQQINRNHLLNFINERAKYFHKENNNDPETCPICYEDFKEQIRV